MIATSHARRSQKSGLAPSTLIHISEIHPEQVGISITAYCEAQLWEKPESAAKAIFPVDGTAVTLINVEGQHDTTLIEQIGQYFGLHPLVLEDVVNTEQRPKLEDYGDYLCPTTPTTSTRSSRC